MTELALDAVQGAATHLPHTTDRSVVSAPHGGRDVHVAIISHQ